MYDFGNANDNQRKAISTVDGPVLITAGPGTGKTFTLVQRAIYMILEKGIQPENIMIATFTEKAAKELITRITNEMISRGIVVNINDMYIGTFHSISLRFIKEHLEYTRMKKNYRTLDSFDQQYTVFQNVNKFRNIEGLSTVLNEEGAWRQANAICSYSNNLSEELVDPDELKKDDNPQIVILGKILETYQHVLEENNLVDFTSLMTEAYRLFSNNTDILSALREKIMYIMVDEYQDTNYIQEQLVLLLGCQHKNICVVGDDDQGLYRFRGATIRNILEFPDKFAIGECKVIPLVTNYRSNSDIVDFYNSWMSTTEGPKYKFKWDNFRYSKTIISQYKTDLSSPAVIKLSGVNDEDEWHEKVLTFIKTLRSSGKINDLNQIAFLFKSVKNDKVIRLATYLEDNGISVYSPRSDMFFMREEIKIMLGCLMLLFPQYVQKLGSRIFDFIDEELCRYLETCINSANQMLVQYDFQPLRKWIRETGMSHYNIRRNTDYAYTGLIYKLFEFEPIKRYLDVNVDTSVVDLRPTRNIALFTQIIAKYEYLHRVDVLSPQKIESDTEKLFNMYLRFLKNGGISEYEDDSEYAPSGCVSFLTIHQSKGMEFPIVVVGSLSDLPRKNYHDILVEVEEKYFMRKAFEPYHQIKYYDFWRLYYTAFSRAQNLLVLSCNETKRIPSKYFSAIYPDLVPFGSRKFNTDEFNFEEIKDVNLKETYSFTSHISVYENCSLQYKFFKELEFTPVRVGATLFGMLIHQTIEDIHRAALRNEQHLIVPDNINGWLLTNYTTLTKSERTYLGQPQIDAALKQVLRYVQRQQERWDHIKEAEVEVSLVKEDYIIKGTIDLIHGDGETVELVDFKSEIKPDLVADKEKIDRYKKQLHVYAHLVEEQTGYPVSNMHIYYTGEESGTPIVSFKRDKVSIDATIKDFDEIVHKIQKKDFSQKSKSQAICENCDLRYYCKK